MSGLLVSIKDCFHEGQQSNVQKAIPVDVRMSMIWQFTFL
jgi:hypothetical protein